MGVRHEKFLACISTNEKTPRHIIRKAARLAAHYNTTFVALYVQTPKENADRIELSSQRHLLNHFKLAAELGGEVMQVASPHVWETIVRTCRERQITTICHGTTPFQDTRFTLEYQEIQKIPRRIEGNEYRFDYTCITKTEDHEYKG